ncbi:MAG TPA: hypothetical protein PKB14_04430 [Rubrivivax sp.]|nr:hypothetical protein [Rubrivivax sp.]
MIARMPTAALGKTPKIATACTSAALALLLTASPALAGGDHDGLEGVWRVMRHGVDCASGTPFPNGFPAIMQFEKDGMETGFAVPPGSAPALTSPEFGTWKRAPGRGNYTFRFLSYSYDLSGAYAGQYDIAGDLKLSNDGKTFAYTATVKFLDAAGQLRFQGCGAAEGRRY